MQTVDQYLQSDGTTNMQTTSQALQPDSNNSNLMSVDQYLANNSPTTPGNSKTGNSSYITSRSQDFGLDPQAVMGVAEHEGMSGAVGDNGTSFGPFQLHAGGALPQEVWQQGADYANKWAWSPEGIDYALKKMSDNGAKGLKGADAVRAIVLNFERPADPTGDLNSGFQAIEGE